jgi:putative transposase
MARPLRIEFAGATYHIMARGNQGQKICLDDPDRERWLATLVATWKRTGWVIHAWALMGNHYHLLLETPEPNLVSGMKWLQGTYTQRFNARHRKRGHLFQGRYRAVPLEREPGIYFQTVSTYIHLNPARAKLLRLGEQKLWEYPWSSYPNYVKAPTPVWLRTQRVLGSLGLGPQDRSAYLAYMESRVLELGIRERRKELEAQWRVLRRGWCLGGESFRNDLVERAERQGGGGSPVRGGDKLHDQSRAEYLLRAGLAALGLAAGELTDLPKGQPEKLVLAWWLYGQTTVPRRWVAEQLSLGYPTRVSQALSLVQSSRDPILRHLKEKLAKLGI